MDENFEYDDIITTMNPVYNSSHKFYNDSNQSSIHASCHSAQSYYLLKIIINVPIVGLLCIFGFIGNLAVILVLGADGIRNNATLLLRALAIADNAYLITCFIFQTLQAVAYHTDWWPALTNGYPYLGKYVWAFASTALTTEMWMIALMTVERYLTVCTPFGQHRWFTKNRVKTIVFIIPVLAVVYNIPRFFEYQLFTSFHHCLGKEILDTKHSEFSENKYYFIIYKTVFFFLFRMIIPMSLVTIFNYKLFQLIRQAKQEHAELTKNQPRVNHTLNKMLVAVVTIYIICQLPDFILRIVTLIGREYPRSVNHMAIYFTNVISNMLLTFNSSVNCLIYCCCGTRFRRMLCRLCCRCINFNQLRRPSFHFRSSLATRDSAFQRELSKSSISQQMPTSRSCSSYLLNNNHSV